MNEEPRKSETGDVLLGIVAAVIGLPVLGYGLSWLIGAFSTLVVLGLYIWALIASWRKGRKGIFKGLLIGLGVYFLLIAACFGVFLFMFMGVH